MQKIILLQRGLFIMLLLIIMKNAQAQTGLNFQGVARTSNNVILASQAITIKLSILQGSATGTADYVETRKVTTNAQGLFTAVIGDTGSISAVGNFATINWKNTPKFLKIELDPAAGTNFITMGTTQFQYVAYAQFANSVNAENIVGMVPVTLGGTGVNSLIGLKTALVIDKINNTADIDKPISTKVQAALDLKSNLTDTTKYTKQTYSDSALLTKLSTTGSAASLTNFPILNQNTTGNAATATTATSAITAGNITATTNTTLTSLSNLATVGTITSGVWSGTAVAVEKGGTGATTAAAARTNLGLVIGTNVQAPLVAGADYLTPTGSAASLTNFPILNQNTTGNAATATKATSAITATIAGTASTATKLATARKINGVDFDGSADINITSISDAGTLTGTTLKSSVTNSSLTSVGTLGNLTVSNPIVGSITGNAVTATKLATARKVNGVDFDGSADITIDRLTAGDEFGGGIVFYTWANGKHGLIAAMDDLKINGTDAWQWSNLTNINTMAKSDGIGAGYKNMLLILARQGQEASPYAASVCNEFKLDLGYQNIDPNTYGSNTPVISDWYLPSIYELKLIDDFALQYAGNDPNLNWRWWTGSRGYWSSTEFDAANAFYLGYQCNNGCITTYSSVTKTTLGHVRPIRMF